MARSYRSIANPNQLPLPGTYTDSAWTPPTFFPVLRGKGVKRIAIDTETYDPGLQELGPGFRRGAKVVGISLGIDQGPRWYFPFRHKDGGNLPEEMVLGWAQKELNAFDGEVVGTQLIYDLDGLANEGITFPNAKRFLDVQIAEPLLDENRFEYNLDALAHDYLGERKNEKALLEAGRVFGFGQKVGEIKSNLWRLHSKFVGIYGEDDVDKPLRILPLQLEKLEQQGLMELFELESKLIPILLAMRRRGVRVDIDKAEQARAGLVKQRDRWLEIVQRHAGPAATFNTADSLGKALEQRGLHVPFTKTGKYSITGGNKGGWLKENSHDELANAIWQGRRVETTITTFIDGHILGHNVNGRIHCEFHQLKNDEGGTIGRFSSANPNLQNVPARDEELMELIRGIFVPDEGEDWERHDESQMEYRFLAHYARGPGSVEFRRRYNEDPKTDYHKFCAEMLGVDPEDKVLRKRVKNTNFAKGYGAMAAKLALTFGCSVEEAEVFIRRYEKALPFTKYTFEEADKTAQKHGHIRSVLGRYARFPLWEPLMNKRKKRQFRDPAYPRGRAEKEYPGLTLVRADTYMALNRLMQLSNADYMKTTMVKLYEAGIFSVLGAPLLTVHDELDFSVPRTKEGDEATKEARYIHEHAIQLRVPVIVDATRGLNWGATS